MPPSVATIVMALGLLMLVPRGAVVVMMVNLLQLMFLMRLVVVMMVVVVLLLLLSGRSLRPAPATVGASVFGML